MDPFFVFFFIIFSANAGTGTAWLRRARDDFDVNILSSITDKDERHTYTSTYTGVAGIPRLPDFTSVSRVDGLEVHYFDSNKNEHILMQTWMKTVEFIPIWKQICAYHDEVYNQLKETFDVKKKSYNKTDIHTYLWIWHCQWDDETNQINRYNHIGFDGEDYIKRDLEIWKMYIPQIPEAANDADSWNNKTHHILQLIADDCIFLLNNYLEIGRATFNRTAPPKVYLLQKNSSSPVVCLATGFYPATVNITWRKNGQEHHENVEPKQTLKNMDDTFQKRISLSVEKEEWERNRYTCVVQHKSLQKDIQKILTEDEIISNRKTNNSGTLHLNYLFIFLSLILIVIVIVYKCYRKNKTNTAGSRDDILLTSTNYKTCQ